MLSEKEAETTRHIPILLEPITDFLADGIRALPADSKPGVILDCTLGGGGHSARLLEKLSLIAGAEKHRVLGVDRDLDAISRNQARFRDSVATGKMEIHHGAFSESMKFIGSRPIYGLLADLGVSSDQIDSESRGFSFRFNAPLDMRMNQTKGVSLLEWLENVSETELAEVIWKYGEERFSRKIARRIVDLRGRGQIPKDTHSLAGAIRSVFPPSMRHQGIHPATRTFQALRIEINEELKELETLIREGFPRTATGGRIAILSFHSLEDRLVKEEFRNRDLYELPFKKPLQADESEVTLNPRSRSAKLRLAIRKVS
ncbi:MAG: 16S rRNA (cytosine(1402)-N(4))-methyltransferase RsmH [Bdellovibrionales bacterium]|nr:16S rRNA (cytosine(1402)-N(4))-methyltransferase RsmH [Bdellovibrionales bacterium]